jgi:hypothetical protein
MAWHGHCSEQIEQPVQIGLDAITPTMAETGDRLLRQAAKHRRIETVAAG